MGNTEEKYIFTPQKSVLSGGSDKDNTLIWPPVGKQREITTDRVYDEFHGSVLFSDRCRPPRSPIFFFIYFFPHTTEASKLAFVILLSMFQPAAVFTHG